MASSIVGSVYRFRWLLFELVYRDIALRYRGSVLGFLWTILNPLLAMLVYTLVFSVFLRVAIPHYALFLLSGLLPWIWFASSISMGATSIVDGRIYVSRSVFAPVLLVMVPICSNLINFVLSIPLFFALAAFFGVPIGLPLLVLPVVIAIQFVLLLALVLMLATYNVFYRDLQQLMVTILSLIFYLAPIFYPLASVPSNFRPFVFLNPMAALVVTYQDIFYYDRVPSLKLLGYALAVSLVLLYIGMRVFDRYKDAFADYA
jgi:ABC-type polysaccharide/polyol phosphate export permease